MERSGSAAEAAKPRPRRRGELRKRVLRNARERVELEEEEVVGRSESEVGDVAEAIFRERDVERERDECGREMGRERVEWYLSGRED